MWTSYHSPLSINYLSFSHAFNHLGWAEYFIMVSVDVDPQPIWRTLRVRQGYTVDGMPVHHSTPYTHMCIFKNFTQICTWGQSTTKMSLDDERKPGNVEETHIDRKICRSTITQVRSCSCEAATLPLINHAKKNYWWWNPQCACIWVQHYSLIHLADVSLSKCRIWATLFLCQPGDLNSHSSKPSEPALSHTALLCGVYWFLSHCFCSGYIENVAIFPPGGELGKCENVENKGKIKQTCGPTIIYYWLQCHSAFCK